MHSCYLIKLLRFLVNQASYSDKGLQLQLTKYDASFHADAPNQSLTLSVNLPLQNRYYLSVDITIEVTNFRSPCNTGSNIELSFLRLKYQYNRGSYIGLPLHRPCTRLDPKSWPWGHVPDRMTRAFPMAPRWKRGQLHGPEFMNFTTLKVQSSEGEVALNLILSEPIWKRCRWRFIKTSPYSCCRFWQGTLQADAERDVRIQLGVRVWPWASIREVGLPSERCLEERVHKRLPGRL